MPDEPRSEPPIADLAAATPEEIAEALSYALRFDERGEPRRGGEIPAAAAGLATLVKAQRVGERLGNFLRRCGGEVSYGWLRSGLVRHGRTLGWTSERNKNYHPRRRREAAE